MNAIAVGIFFLSSCAAQSLDAIADRIAKDHQDKVVMLAGLDDDGQPLAFGTGFFIDGSGAVATGARVIAGASKVIVDWGRKEGTVTRVLRFDSRYDLVVLQTSYRSTPAVRMRDSDTVTPGEPVVVLGSAYAFGRATSVFPYAGELSGDWKTEGVGYLGISSRYGLGCAGGPVLDANGALIGIATPLLGTGRQVNLVLPSNLLKSLPAAEPPVTSVKPPPAPPDGIQNLRDAVHADNIREGYLKKELKFLFYTLRNTTELTLCSFVVLISVKDPSNLVSNPMNVTERACVPPGLDKEIITGLSMPGRPPVMESGKGLALKWTVRVLDFKVKQEAR